MPGGSPASDVLLSGVTLDSRRVRPGDLYAALPGEHAHGAMFAAQAAAAGAAAVLTDPVGEGLLDAAGVTLPHIVVDEPRAVLGRLSARIYGDAGAELTLVGVTGTNGKTTTTYIVEAALRALGRRTGLIGTIETRIGDRSIVSERTTPESCDLHALFAAMQEDGVQACAMEVSSHALALHRVDGADFDVAVFLNMSQDHLDFHGTMEEYYASKAALFSPERARVGVVCVDDAWGARLAEEAKIPVITVSTREDPAGTAQWRLVSRRAAGDPDAFDLVGPANTLILRGVLPGAHNRANTAFAALTLLAAGISPEDVEKSLYGTVRVPGRLERVDLDGAAPQVFVDFAHTPEAIRAALEALRPLTTGSLICLVGAGGHRDSGKRPLMGAAAARGADVVVVTDDNPRDEDPAVIREDVAAGARNAGVGERVQVHDVAGRGAAIAYALTLAGPEDTIAVLGRGHETKQEVMGDFLPFDDRDAVRTAWSRGADL